MLPLRLLSLILICSLTPTRLAEQQPPLKVTIPVSIQTESGQFVTDIQEQNLRIPSLDRFKLIGLAGGPRRIVLLIDFDRPWRNRWDRALSFCHRFIDQLNPLTALHWPSIQEIMRPTWISQATLTPLLKHSATFLLHKPTVSRANLANH